MTSENLIAQNAPTLPDTRFLRYEDRDGERVVVFGINHGYALYPTPRPEDTTILNYTCENPEV